MPRATTAQREAQLANAAAGGRASRLLDPIDRQILDYEHMLAGPHDVGIPAAEYRERVTRLLADPIASEYARLTVERMRQRYG